MEEFSRMAKMASRKIFRHSTRYFSCLYEYDFMLRTMQQVMTIAVQFSNTFRCIDNLFSVNNEHFGHYINAFYPVWTGECYLDTRIKTGDSNTPFHLSVYDKRDDFSFRIVLFPYIDSNIPANLAYGVYISQLVRYARICTSKLDFVHRLRRLSTRLLHQGFKSTLLGKSLPKFFKRHGAIIEKYGITLREMRVAIQDWETRRIFCYFKSFIYIILSSLFGFYIQHGACARAIFL